MSRLPKFSKPPFKFTWRSGLWLPVVALAMVLLALVPGESEPDETVGKPREIPSNSAVVACPVDAGTETMLGQLVAGQSADLRAIPEAKIDPIWAQVDTWRTGEAPVGTLVVTQYGDGSGPTGFVAGTANKGSGGGQLLSRCPGLLDEGWLVGMGDNKGKSVIRLTNLGDSMAVVDVYWYSPLGPVEGDDSIGIAIEAGTTKTLKIGDHVPSENVIGAHVVRRRQQVSAVALSADKSGSGTEYVLPQRELSRNVVLAGLPSKGSTSVSVLNPHDETVLIKVRGIRANEAFDIQGLEEVPVKPGSTAQFDIPANAKLGGHSIELVAEQPFAAFATVQTAKDIAIVGKADVLDRPSAVPVKLKGQNVNLTLVAPNESTAVVIEGVDQSMKVVSKKNISLPAGSSTTIDLAKEPKGATAAIVTVDGTAFAGVWTRKGDLIASTTSAPAPVSVRVPAVAVR